jgi:hypothetical protein
MPSTGVAGDRWPKSSWIGNYDAKGLVGALRQCVGIGRLRNRDSVGVKSFGFDATRRYHSHSLPQIGVDGLLAILRHDVRGPGNVRIKSVSGPAARGVTEIDIAEFGTEYPALCRRLRMRSARRGRPFASYVPDNRH